MKRVLDLLSSLLNLRSLCVIITLVLLSCPLSLTWLTQPNRFLFSLGAHLTPKPEPASQLVKLVIPQSEMDRLVNDMPGALGIGSALQGLHGVFTKGVLLILDAIPHTENYATDVLVTRLVSDPALRESLQASGVLADIEALGQRRDNFYAQVLDGSLLLGIAQTSVAKEKVNYLREASVVPVMQKPQTLPTRLYTFFQPTPLLLTNFRFESRTPGYPVYSNSLSVNAYPLLWRVGNDYFPDAIVALLKKARGINQVTGKPQRLGLDDQSLPMSEGNVIYPMFSSVTGLPDHIETVTLDDLKSPADYNRFYNKTVIIGVENNQQVNDMAAAYYSLDKRAYYTVPDWYIWAEKGGLLLLLLYLFLLLPLLRINLGLMMTAFLAAALLVLQIGLQISQMQWLPVGLLLGYLLVGHLCALLWMLQKKFFYSASASKTTNQKIIKHEQVKQKPRAAPGFFEKTAALMKPQGLKSLGRYVIDSELARGAMGVVYLGHDPKMSRKVAIKTLNYAQYPPEDLKEMKERFFREAKGAGNLSHPHIVTIYDQGEESDLAYIAMEFVNGKPLSSYTQKNNLIKDWDEIYWIIECVADALNFAHKNKVIHRDIKPSNILYNRDREPRELKVADFGIARFENSASTRTGEILGSPLYMSPEQVKGEEVTGKTDIYSLGVTFYQLLTGELPYGGDSLPAITHQIVQGKFTPVTELNHRIPDSAQRIIAKAMHKDPEKRYANAEEMMNDIARYRAKGL